MQKHIQKVNCLIANAVSVQDLSTGFAQVASGTYAILNTKTLDVYVGQSQNLNKRLNDHRSYLKRNAHGNIILRRSFTKYGENCFKFIIIELCDEVYLDEKEQQLLDTFFGKYCYNLSPTASSVRGSKRSESQIEVMSEQKREYWANEDNRSYLSSRMKEGWLNPESKKIRSEISKSLWEDEEYRSFHKQFTTDMWKNPSFVEKRSSTVEASRNERLKNLSEEERVRKERDLANRRRAAAKFRAKKKAEREALLSQNLT